MTSLLNPTVYAFFTPGPMELVIIGLIAVLLFGSRLPSVMRNLGRGVVEFKKGVRGVEDEIESASTRAASYDDAEERDEATAPKFEPPPSEEANAEEARA